MAAAYDVCGRNAVPYIDVAGTMGLFLLNRDLNKPRDMEIIWRDTLPKKVRLSHVLTGQDLNASNSFKNPILMKRSLFSQMKILHS